MEHLTAAQLHEAADAILNEPSFRLQVEKTSESFKKAGGYLQAVDEIFKFKIENGI